jgi:hypothetical protein
LLRHRDERHSFGVEQFDQPGEIGERPREPVDLVDDDNVDPAGPDIGSSRCSAGRARLPPENPPSS